MVELDRETAPPDGFEQTRGPEPGDIPGVRGVVEACPDLPLSAQMIHLVGPEVVDEGRDLLGVCEIAIVQEEPSVRVVQVLVDVVYPSGVERAGLPSQPMDLVPLRKYNCLYGIEVNEGIGDDPFPQDNEFAMVLAGLV